MLRDLRFLAAFALCLLPTLLLLAVLFAGGLGTLALLLLLPLTTLAAELISRPKPEHRNPRARHGWSIVRCTAVLVLLGALPLALLLDAMSGAAVGGPRNGAHTDLPTLLFCAALLTSALVAPVLLLLRQYECPQAPTTDSEADA
ncbi:hypothetical protein [Inhella sp.]|uniref:hypothetical protein n=1 Tax=Inhella sp. TaxID=1921806 RepID=UPI0035B0BD82